MSDLCEEIYQKTQDYGRTQFVELLQQNQIKIEQLQQENEQLKSTLKGTTHCYDKEEHQRLVKENEELKKYCCKRNDCVGRLKQNNKLTDSEILIEFEKWLWEKLNIKPANKIYASECLEKLQELKEREK